MSNTLKRIIAGIIMLVMLLVLLSLKPLIFLVVTIIIGNLLVDEGTVNIFKEKRFNVTYFLTQLSYLLIIVLFYCRNLLIIKAFIWAAISINFLALTYLFITSIECTKTIDFLKSMKMFWGLYFLLIISSFCTLIIVPGWRHNILLLLILCFGTDTGAWFFGRLFGKRKLWPTVSPKKTIEGLFGGALFSGILACTYFDYFMGTLNWRLVIIFPLLGAVSHLGDLIQSKLKRQCGVKNSSSLIPGHGGVYDRLDSVLFLAPFYSAVVIFI